MISIQQAIEIAKKVQTEYQAIEVIDLKDKWCVSFDSGDIPIPGIPLIIVDKKSGEPDILTVPPIENLELIESSTVVWNRDEH